MKSDSKRDNVEQAAPWCTADHTGKSATASASGLLVDRPRRHADLLALLSVCLLGVIVYGRGITQGGGRWPDCTVHAMNGVLIHDWIASGPDWWFRPMEFACRQYAHYPSLGIGLHHPPGLAIAEAAAFSVFGISIVVARAVVVAFGVLALVGFYLLMRKATTVAGAVLGTGLMICMPLVVLWARQTMLEIPAVAVLIWSSYLFLRYLDRPLKGRLFAFLAVVVLLPFFKQTTVFLLPVFGLWALVRRKKLGIPASHLVVGALAFLLLPGTYFFMIFSAGTFYARSVGSTMPFMVRVGKTFLSTVTTVARGAGWLGFALAVAGGAVSLVSKRSRLFFLACFWFASFVLMWSLCFSPYQAGGEPRFLLFGLVPFAIFAGLGLGQLVELVRPERVRAVAVAALMLGAGVMGFVQRVPIGPDYGPIVGVYSSRIHGNIVMFSGQRDADFVLAVRQLVGPRSAIVLRSSKMLYYCANHPRSPNADYRELVSDMNDVEKVLDDLGVSAVFVVREDVYGIRPEKLLRAYLEQSQKYVRISAVAGNKSGPTACPPVDVYVRLKPAVRTAKYLELLLPMVGKSIKVDIDSLGIRNEP